MTNLEKALVKALEAASKSCSEHAQKIDDLRAALGKKCTHSQTFDFYWEHDNGYGRQTMIKGVECRLCHAQKRWKDMSDWERNDY